MQNSILPIIKSENEGRLKENINALKGLFDDSKSGGALSKEDISKIDTLNKGQSIFMGWYNML